MVNFVVCQGFGLEFLAKAKPLRPRPQNSALRPIKGLTPRTNTNITDCTYVKTGWLYRLTVVANVQSLQWHAALTSKVKSSTVRVTRP